MMTKTEIIETLTNLGLRRGDILFVHSSLKAVGPIDGGAEALIEAMLEVVGAEGLLAMPAFNYTRPLPEPYFDLVTTPARTGVLTEIFRKTPGVLRSLHPTHSVCAKGAAAEEFLKGHLNVEAVGIGSPIDKMAQADGYVLLIGVTHLANTTIHVGEAYAGVKKFHWTDGPSPIAKIKTSDGEVVERELDSSASCDTAFNALEHPLRSAYKIIDLKIGDALSYLMRGQDVIDATVEIIGAKPDILFCQDPNCGPCSLGREFMKRKNI